MKIKNNCIPVKLFLFPLSLTFFIFACKKDTIDRTYGKNAVSCVDTRCTAVGQFYEENNSKGMAWNTYSEDGGLTYTSASKTKLPADANPAKSSQLYAVNCRGSKCVSVGYYNLVIPPESPGVFGSPLIVMSDDYGKTYPTPMSTPLPEDALPNRVNAFRDVTHFNQRWIAVGSYNVFVNTMTGGINESKPYVAITDMNGKTFNKTLKIPIPNGASIPVNAMLYSVDCASMYCVIAGIYNVSVNSTNVSRPFILRSVDGGETFNEFATISIANDVDSTKNMELRSITCENSNCLAVGYYSKVSPTPNGSFPLILRSTDDGKTFSMISNLTLPSDADLTKSSQFKSVHCFDLKCVAGGVYNLNYFGGPPFSGEALSAFSDDGGQTFITKKVSLPTNNISGKISILTGVGCAAQGCFGVGSYNQDLTLSSGLPLSNFADANQSQFTNASQPTLPSDADLKKSNSLGDLNP